MSEGGTALRGQRALVVGGATGIGKAISVALAAAGADVAVADIAAQRANDVADQASAFGVRAFAVIGDVGDAAEVERIVQESRADLGGIDIVVTVVGGARVFGLSQAPIHELTDGHIDTLLEMNLAYVFRVVRACVNVMLDQGTGGSIVSIGSISGGATGYPTWAPYGAAKAGLSSLARSVAVQYGPAGIRMNVVSPGFTLTPAYGGPVDELDGLIPLGRMGTPEDIANAVLFFASPQSSYVSGQTLAVDGAVSLPFPAT